VNELLWLIAGVAAIALVALLLLRRPRKGAIPTGFARLNRRTRGGPRWGGEPLRPSPR
jgi:hypothetical protein